MKRNKFSLSNYRLFSCDMGELIPCGLFEVLPGDSIQQSTSLLVRASPLLAPVMHPVDVRIHHWYVPHRLVWDNWENFITGGPDGLNASVFPFKDFAGGVSIGSLSDYMGVPPGFTNLKPSALPFRGYNLIWNNWYRDQDLEGPASIVTTDGSDSGTATFLQNCSWEKDYFTSSRPWEQKGPTITLPLGTTAPVKGIGFTGTMPAGATNQSVRETTPLPSPRTFAFSQSSPMTQVHIESDSTGGAATKPLIYADLSNATSVTINQLRQSLALQRFEEARARYGSRYVEYLRYLGIKSSDARLQLPEYLGGGRQTIQFSEIVQTGPGATSAVGELKGHGIAAVRSNRYRRFFEEHGYVFTLASIRPKTIYMQGLKRTFNRKTKNDFWQKEFEHIGQQQVLNKEVYAGHSNLDGVFGYQDRYDEYRREESFVSGEFRTVLNFWHFAREFSSDPALNQTFVKCVPTERTFAVNTNDVLWCMAKHSVQARRLVAAQGTSMTF